MGSDVKASCSIGCKRGVVSENSFSMVALLDGSSRHLLCLCRRRQFLISAQISIGSSPLLEPTTSIPILFPLMSLPAAIDIVVAADGALLRTAPPGSVDCILSKLLTCSRAGLLRIARLFGAWSGWSRWRELSGIS